MLHSRNFMPKHSSPRYYTSPKDVKKQLPFLSPIVIVFLIAILYASGLQNHSLRMVILVVALMLLILMALIILASMSKFNYYTLNSHGIHVTTLGVFSRTIDWSKIKLMEATLIGHVKGIGIMYKPGIYGNSWSRKFRRKYFGWDEIIADAHTRDGVSLLKEIEKQKLNLT